MPYSFVSAASSQETASGWQQMLRLVLTIESRGRTVKNSREDIHTHNWTNDKSMAARYAPIHDMVTELLAKIDPDGCTQMLENFRSQYQPAGVEERVVELMADLVWRTRGCFYLETEILKRGMQACATPNDTPGQELGRAYLRDIKGPNLLSKLSRYQSRLSREFSRCIRIMELGAKNRKYKEARIAATLAKSKPCTSVVQ
jgi:hypothetical protein